MGLEAVMDMAQFNKGQKQYMSSVAAMDKQTSKASGLITGAFKAIGSIASGILGAQIISGIGREIKSLVQDAVMIPSVASAFEGLGGSIERMREGALGMVVDVELMKSFNTAAGLVSKDFAQTLPDAMQYLAKVSASTGQSMSFMMDSYVKAVGRVSPMIADNMNIQVTLAEATERAAQMFNVQTDAVSKSQQQMGMANVILEKLRVNTAAMPDVVGSAAQQMAVLQTTVANLKNELGVGLIPIFQELIRAITPVVEELQKVIQTEEFQTGMREMAESISLLANSLVTALPDFVEFVRQVNAANEAVKPLVEWLDKWATVQGLTTIGMELGTQAVEHFKGPIDEAIAAMADFDAASREEIGALKEFQRTVKETVETYEELPQGVMSASQATLAHIEGFADQSAEAVKTLVDDAVKDYDRMVRATDRAISQAFSSVKMANLLGTQAATLGRHLLQMEQMEGQHGRTMADLRFRYDMQQNEAQARYQQERQGLMEAGKGEEAALLDSKFENQTIASEQQYSRDQQLQQRNYLLQQAQQKRAYIVQLQDMQDQTLRMLMETIKAQVAEGGVLTKYQAWQLTQIANAGSKILQIDAATYIAQLRLREKHGASALTLQEKINAAIAAIAAGEAEAEEAIAGLLSELADLEAELSTGYELPPLDTTDFQDSAREAAKPVERAMTQLVDDMTKGMQSILKFEETLERMMKLQEEFVAEEVPDITRWTTRFEGVMRQVVASIRRVLYLFEAEEAETLAKLASDMSKMYEAVIRDFSDIKEYDLPDMVDWANQLVLISQTIIEVLQDLAEEFSSEGLIDARIWGESVGAILNLIEDAVDAMKELTEYQTTKTLAADMKNLADRIIEILPELMRVVEVYKTEGKKTAEEFAEQLGKVLGIIKPAIEALGALAEYEPLTGLQAKWQNVQYHLNLILGDIKYLADIWEEKGLKDVAEFAGYVVDILKIIEASINALNALEKYKPLRDLQSKWWNIQHHLYLILQDIDYLADLFQNYGMEQTAEFAGYVITILKMMEESIVALNALAEYKPLRDLQSKWWNIQHHLYLILQDITFLASRFDLEGIQETAAFATAVGEIIAIIEPAIQALAAIKE